MNTIESPLRGAAIAGLILACLSPAADSKPQQPLPKVQEALLTAELAPAHADFGQAIDISGDRAVIGASPDDPMSGTAYVYKRDLGTGEWSFESKLVPPAGSARPFDMFGAAVAIDGTRIAVGAPGDDQIHSGSGAVYTYELIGGQWTLEQELHSPAAEPNGRFGRGLDLSGDSLIVGAWREDATAEDSGAVHVFRRPGAAWAYSQTLTSTFAIEDEHFGFAIDCTLTRLVIGATGFPAGDDTGAAYVYELTGNSWQQMQQLTGANSGNLGHSVAILGTHVLAGAPSTDGAGTARGAVYYFREGAVSYTFRQVVHGTQDEELFGSSVAMAREDVIEPSSPLRAVMGGYRYEGTQEVQGHARFMLFNSTLNWLDDETADSPQPTAYGRFGNAVAIQGRSALIAEVGASTNFRSEGAVHAYEHSANSWNANGVLRGTEQDANQLFGDTVALHQDLAVIGMPGDDDTLENAGGALVYEREGGAWQPVAKLSAETDASSGALFGSASATDGTTIVIGARAESHASNFAGAAYVYRKTDAGEWKSEARLIPSDPTFEGWFGTSVDVSGDRVVVGAPGVNVGVQSTGVVYVFVRDDQGNWSEEDRLWELAGSPNAQAGTAVAIDGDRLVVGAAGLAGNTGLALTYTRQGSTWMFENSIQGLQSTTHSRFAESLSLEGTTLIVGAPGELQDVGAVYVYERTDLDYLFMNRIAPTPGADVTAYGRRVDLEGDLLVVGSHLENTHGLFAGGAHAYRKVGSLWIGGGLAPPVLLEREFYGSDVAVSEDTVLVGAIGRPAGNVENAGAAYTFQVEYPEPIQVIGLGDGSEGDCPCGNESPAGLGQGCINSTGAGGLLGFQGSADILVNDLSLHASNLRPGVYTQLFSGTGFLGAVPFENGLRFIGGQVRRLQLLNASPAGTADWADLHAQGDWMPGDLRYFQVFYRDVTGPCGGGANLTNGLQISFPSH